MGDVVWLRRDLRRADLPILGRAAESGPVTVAFVVDPPLWETSAGSPRRGWLATTLLALRETYEGCLTLRTGDPRTEIPRLATEVGASAVHISEETEPDGSARDQDVEKALGDVPLSSTGSPYAVTPGRVRTGSGGAYQRFTPFSTAWREHGWRAPASEPADLALAEDLSDEKVWKVVTEAAAEPGPDQPPAGETAALERWHEFLDDHLGTYDANRDRPDLRATSGLSPYLKLGVLHPRTLLADVAGRSGKGASSRSWRGASSTPTCSTTTRAASGRTCVLSWRRWPMTTPQSWSRRGDRAGPACRWSMPECGSCSRPAGCTTGCGW